VIFYDLQHYFTQHNFYTCLLKPFRHYFVCEFHIMYYPRVVDYRTKSLSGTHIPWILLFLFLHLFLKEKIKVIHYYLRPVILISFYKTNLNCRLVLGEAVWGINSGKSGFCSGISNACSYFILVSQFILTPTAPHRYESYALVGFHIHLVCWQHRKS
jgi:hypothetical protein